MEVIWMEKFRNLMLYMRLENIAIFIELMRWVVLIGRMPKTYN